jgi:hypothetical protein
MLLLLPLSDGLCVRCCGSADELFDDGVEEAPNIRSLALLYSSSLSLRLFFFSLPLSFAPIEFCTFSRRKICGGGGAVTACWYSPDPEAELVLNRRGLSTVEGRDRFANSGCGCGASRLLKEACEPALDSSEMLYTHASCHRVLPSTFAEETSPLASSSSSHAA